MGVLQTADGWRYAGSWKNDELHGEAIISHAYNANLAKEVCACASVPVCLYTCVPVGLCMC